MARDHRVRDDRGPRHYYDDEYSSEDRDRERRHRRRHRHRDRDYDDDDRAVRRERRERRRAEETRRDAELDIDELRARRASYYSRPDEERRRDSQRMAQELRDDRGHSRKEVRRDGTRRKKRTRERVVDEERSDDYVYGRPKSRGVVEEVTVRRASPNGGSSSRTAYTPRSGSNSASLRRGELPKLGRSVSSREPTRVYTSTRAPVRRSSTVKLPSATPMPVSRHASVSTRDTTPRRGTGGGLLATLFSKPAPRTPTTTVHKEVPRVECLVCMADNIPATKTAKLGCGHRMCHSCLKRQFTLSVSDPAHMPPTCCNSEHIPLKYVERLFDDKFKRQWNKKYEEYTAKNRLYCPMKGCGEWIKPSKIRVDSASGRKYARCGRCSTKVCVLCNGKFHTRRECPRDEETNRLVELAKEKGWQRCYNCRAVVELKEGCNHMTCRCTAQFCMVCAAPWKTCSCPWFDYSHLDESDRLNDMRVPHTRPQQDVVEVIEMPDIEPRSPPRRSNSTRIRQPAGQRDRTLDRTDEALAAHLQAQMRLDTNASESHRGDPNVQVYGLGNFGSHHMNDSYAVRPPRQASRTAPRQSAPRTSFFSRRLLSTRAPPPPPAAAKAGAMAGLPRDGNKRGHNRVGSWLNYVECDAEAINTAPRGVEVDDWRVEGSMVGID